MTEPRASYSVTPVDAKALRGAIKAEVRRLNRTDSTSYEGPEPSLIRAVIQYSELTQQAAADLLRVNVSTVRRWTASADQRQHREMPYAAWCVLLQYTELSTLDQLAA